MRLGRPVVGDRRRKQGDVDVGERKRGVEHRLGGRRRNRLDAVAAPATCRLAASRITSAPRRRASSASATPMRPDERLPTKRTLSSGSRVPPAVTSTRGRRASRARAAARRARRSPRAPRAARPPTRPRPARLRRGRRARRRARRSALDIRARRRVRPHARVHRRRDEHRPAMGERRLGEHVVGDARARAWPACSPCTARRRADRRASDAGRGPPSAAGAPARGTSPRATNRCAPGVTSGTTSWPALTSRRVSSHAL